MQKHFRQILAARWPGVGCGGASLGGTTLSAAIPPKFGLSVKARDAEFKPLDN